MDNILAVIIVFSLLVFVHELGHYLAAVFTGVRVEKFMIGFDIWGLGLKFKIRGTEYGIGALPLGGYVKLAGASDLPGEEGECTGAPDELMSKGIGARGLIFIAGVVMNMIFGFFLLVGAQLYGVPRMPAVLGYVVEGGPAYRAGLRTGDKVLSIDNDKANSFGDIQEAVAMSIGKPISFTIERDSTDGLVNFTRMVVAEPGQGRGNIYQIMAQPPISRIVGGWEEKSENLEELKTQIKIGDRIIKVDDDAIENDLEGGKIDTLLQDKIGTEVILSVQSPIEDGWSQPRSIKVYVTPHPVSSYNLGLRYKAYIKSVEPGGPADRAGLKPGDWIAEVSTTAGETDYITQNHPLAKHIGKAAFQEISITVTRGEDSIEVPVTPRAMTADLRIPLGQDNFLGVILNENNPNEGLAISKVLEGGPASNLLQAGDIITAVNGNPLEEGVDIVGLVNRFAVKAVTLTILRGQEEQPVKFTFQPEVNPVIGIPRIGIVQAAHTIYGVEPGSQAEKLALGSSDSIKSFTLSKDLKETTLSWLREGETTARTQTFATPQEVLDNPAQAGIYGSLGVMLKPDIFIDKSPSFMAACSSALPLTWAKTTTIFNFLGKLISGDFSLTATGGPILIFKVMYASAEAGFGRLLDIAALISINLAVLNILPIPVLDGGHLFFLLIELIKGSRPSVRVREYAQYAGFICLMSLMLLLTTFDVYYSWFQSWFGG